MTESLEGTASARTTRILERLPSALTLPVWIVLITVASSGATLLLAHRFSATVRHVPVVFIYLFLRDEPLAAELSCALVAVGILGAAVWRNAPLAVVARLSQRPRAFVGIATALFSIAAVVAYRAHPLSMDEYAPVFQAGVFAHGKLTGQVPPALVPRLLPPWPAWFLEASPAGRLISSYWPGFALLLTPFAAAGCPWLLNPLLGGAALALLWWIARRLQPGTTGAGWTLLIATASPAFLVNAISFYSMTAHLLASLCFVALLLDPTPRRLFAAGALGSFAMSLHNPLPHVLFALPWLVWLAVGEQRVRRLATIAAGYLPGTVVLCGGWVWLRGRIHPSPSSHAFSATVHELWSYAFALPSRVVVVGREINTVELILWSLPGLLVLAAAGAWRYRAQRPVRLLAASAVLTFVAYLFVPYDQGHGWGYRYFHSAWGTLPLLAGMALGHAEASGFLKRLVLVVTLCSLVIGNAVRLVQVRTFIDRHLRQIPATESSGRLEVVFVKIDQGYYIVDLVQNDPFMNGRRWVLISYGDASDEQFMQESFPRSHLVARGQASTVWEVD